MNGRIEKAYNQKKGRITFVEELEDGGQKNIVLDLVQELETDGTSTVKMRRRDLSKAGSECNCNLILLYCRGQLVCGCYHLTFISDQFDTN